MINRKLSLHSGIWKDLRNDEGMEGTGENPLFTVVLFPADSPSSFNACTTQANRKRIQAHVS
jgi:hypothetical protein